MKQRLRMLSIALAIIGFVLLAIVASVIAGDGPAPGWALTICGLAFVALAAAMATALKLDGTGQREGPPRERHLDRHSNSSNLSRDQLDRLLHSLNEALFFVSPEGKIQEANRAAGLLLDRDPESLVDVDMDGLLRAHDRRRNSRQASWQPKEALFRRAAGDLVCVSYTRSEIFDDDGNLLSIVYAVQNIDARKQAEKRIRYLARVDGLTKFANRMQFQHQLQQAIARARRESSYLAILYLDVDRFKDINDTFGHAAGDSSLEIFSQRISEELPDDAIPGRLAGDEFCVMLKRTGTIENAANEIADIASRLLTTVGRPFRVGGEEIFMSTSIGAAIYPRDGENVVDLLRNADAALYQAKRAGGNCLEFFGDHIASASEERLMLKSKLRRAFERDELRLDYQPKYRLEDGRLAGVEALIRWDLPERGIVLPSDFIPIAEESNLILQLGEWVLDRVCADFRSWQRQIPSPCRVAINLSLRQLQQQRFLEGVRKTFRTHGVSPTSFELEITETTLMQDIGRTIRILDALYSMGMHLAIDDFGTGYSSLSALQQFPISTLKIDQSFVRDLSIDQDNAAIVRTIIRMGKSLKLDVVAEGVENEEQLNFLQANGCDIVQGHLFGEPVSAEEVGKLLVTDAEGSGRFQALFA